MAGIDNILSMITSQQEKSEYAVISAAEKKANAILAEAEEKAAKEQEEYISRAKVRLEQEYKNACASADGDMKRRQLAYKVKCVDEVIEKTVEKLNRLPDDEYFAVLEKLLADRVQPADGVLSLSRRDLGRITADFKSETEKIAKKAGGTIAVSDTPADIEDGFILTYGLISENCSFSAIIEAERESIRDTAAKALFG